MKKLFILILIAGMPSFSNGQSCDKSLSSSCSKTSCGPEGTKKAEAAVIGSMRTDLQGVVTRMSKSSLSFSKEVSEMEIEKGTSDDESLLFISQAVNAIRFELMNKIDPSKLIASLKEYQPARFSTKQQMVSALKKEIQMLTSQAEKL
jgi:hypothetical protein